MVHIYLSFKFTYNLYMYRCVQASWSVRKEDLVRARELPTPSCDELTEVFVKGQKPRNTAAATARGTASSDEF